MGTFSSSAFVCSFRSTSKVAGHAVLGSVGDTVLPLSQPSCLGEDHHQLNKGNVGEILYVQRRRCSRAVKPMQAYPNSGLQGTIQYALCSRCLCLISRPCVPSRVQKTVEAFQCAGLQAWQIPK